VDVLVAFLTAVAVTLVEVASKYERAPRVAIMNTWATTFMLLNGLASAAVYCLAEDIETLSFGIPNPYLKAVVIGIEWQILLRSKVFSIGETSDGREVQVGLEYVYRRYAQIFERQIERYEEGRVLEEIHRLRQRKGLTEKQIKSRAIDFVDYKRIRKKITKSEADKHKEAIEKSTTDAVMYIVFELSSLSSLKKLFFDDDQPLDPTPQPPSSDSGNAERGDRRHDSEAPAQ
jgi:hypothetical protein